jgi:hypothetical protein
MVPPFLRTGDPCARAPRGPVVFPLFSFKHGTGLLDFSVLTLLDSYPTVCSCLFRRIPLSRDRPHSVYLALSLFVEGTF